VNRAKARAAASSTKAGAHITAGQTPAWDDDHERRARLLLLGKGAVLARRLALPLAAELDEKQCASCRLPAACVSVPLRDPSLRQRAPALSSRKSLLLLPPRRQSLRCRGVPLSLRVAGPGDGAALAALHEEMGTYYAGLASRHFRRPDVDGLASDLDRELRESSEDELVLVAEAGGQIVGALWAALFQPAGDAERQIERDVAQRRVRIDYVVTSAARRRQGIAAQLVEAAEAWGRAKGATIAEASTYRASPLSFPFWTRRMGYEERTVNLRKRLS
jgi:GNAT superfamily N-acetyltransferase